MAELTKKDLEEILQKAVEYAPRESVISNKTHASHHQYVEILIEKRAKRLERWEKAQQSVIGTAITFLAAGLVWIGKIVLDYIQKGGSH